DSGGYERWEFWWERNKDAYLNLKSRLAEGVNVSGSSGFLTGRGSKDSAFNTIRPSQKIIHSTMIPALKGALGEDHADILDAVALALARITASEEAGLVLPDILGLLNSKHESAMQSATLGLGVLGAPDPSDALYELLIDSAQGRHLVGRHEVPVKVRAFAALSLGFINNSAGADRLIQVIRRAPDRESDLKAAAITALGLMRNNPRQDAIMDLLIQLLKERKMDPLVKSCVPISLGKLGDPTALPALLATFRDKQQSDPVLQSCAIALGLIGEITDEEVIRLLKSYIENGNDRQTQNFSFMALAQIGANDKAMESHSEAHMALMNFLLKNVVMPDKTAHRPWAALAAAIHARAHGVLQPAVINKIRESFERHKNPSHRAAMAISLGLLNAQGEADLLLDEFKASHEDALKGYICVSLGLMNHKASADRILDVVGATHSDGLRLKAAMALGLMGDRQVVDLLVQVLKNGETVSVTASAARALGLIGDVHAIPLLCEIVGDKKTNDTIRGFAVCALGLIGEKTDLPWYAVITENFNYRSCAASLTEIFDLL
ncbi:MAG: HEAT repeat domain-containing protein, partial [Planctomycetota bacterium]